MWQLFCATKTVRQLGYLERDEQCDSLDAVVSTVHVIPHEQVVGVGRAAPDAEQLHQVVELPVDIPAHGHGTFHLLHVRLLREDLLSLGKNTTIRYIMITIYHENAVRYGKVEYANIYGQWMHKSVCL